jgi:hypothetical protein
MREIILLQTLTWTSQNQKGVFTAENAGNAEKNKEENLCTLCVLRGKILVFCART